MIRPIINRIAFDFPAHRPGFPIKISGERTDEFRETECLLWVVGPDF